MRKSQSDTIEITYLARHIGAAHAVTSMRHGRAHRVISRARGTPGAPPRSEQGVPAAAGAAFGGPYGPELGPPTAALAAAFGGGPGFARAPRVSHIAYPTRICGDAEVEQEI